MASNKTQSVKKVAATAKARTKAKTTAKAKAPAKAKPSAKAKAPAKAKAAPVKVGPRHPRARVIELHGSKAALAAAVAKAIAHGDQDTGSLEARLKTASNAQLLRLSQRTQVLKEKFGNREKLIAAIGEATRKTKDKDYLAKLDSYSLPQLLDLHTAAQRAART